MTISLTSDEREKLETIRRQLASAASSATIYIDHVSFLLSLLDSQAEELRLLRIATANPEDSDLGATVYNGEGNYTLLAQNAIDRHIAAMRTACVEKVREYLTDCRDEERGIIEAIASELDAAANEAQRKSEQ